MMESVLMELDSVINLLESKLPANPESPENQRLVGRLERNMASYFIDLERAFPYGEVEALYYKLVKQG